MATMSKKLQKKRKPTAVTRRQADLEARVEALERWREALRVWLTGPHNRPQ